MFDLGQQGRSVTYLNFRQAQDATESRTCSATQEFNYSNFIDNSSEYIIAIERLKVPIHRIPMQPPLAPALTITRGGLNALIGIAASFSVKHFIDQLNAACAEELVALAGAGGGAPPTCIFKLSASGFLTLNFSFANGGDDAILLSPELAILMDIKPNLEEGDELDGLIIGASSVFDRFDQLEKVQIEARGLNVEREIINTDTTLPILTDIIIPTTYSVSYQEVTDPNTASNKDLNISYPTRQNVLYGGDIERRFINLVGQLAVQNITIQAVGVFRDGTRNQIILPKGSSFECKLAFFKK